MFKLSTTPTYFATVSVEFPDGDGKTKRATFDAEFRRLSQSELESFQQRVSDGILTDSGFAAEVLVGWRGVKDEDDSDLPFSEANRERLLDIYPVRPSVIKAFYESIAGAKAKN